MPCINDVKMLSSSANCNVHIMDPPERTLTLIMENVLSQGKYVYDFGKFFFLVKMTSASLNGLESILYIYSNKRKHSAILVN